jgi:hypothetical protein
MSLYLLAPDLARLINWLLLNRPVSHAVVRPIFVRPWLNRGGLVLRTVLVAVVTGLSVWVSWYHQRHYGDWAPRPPLYGIWDVEEFQLDGKPHPPLLSDRTRWRRIIFPEAESCVVQLMDDSVRRCSLQMDTNGKSFTITRTGDPVLKGAFACQDQSSGNLLLTGTFNGHPLAAKAYRVDISRWPIMRRLHWVHEPSFEQ